jgi:hypothetical protein
LNISPQFQDFLKTRLASFWSYWKNVFLIPDPKGSGYLCAHSPDWDTVANITGATNASPIVVTAASHNLVSGSTYTVSGVIGNTAANGTWVIGTVTTNTFALVGSTGNSAYVSGGSVTTQTSITEGLSYALAMSALMGDAATFASLYNYLLAATNWKYSDTPVYNWKYDLTNGNAFSAPLGPASDGDQGIAFAFFLAGIVFSDAVYTKFAIELSWGILRHLTYQLYDKRAVSLSLAIYADESGNNSEYWDPAYFHPGFYWMAASYGITGFSKIRLDGWKMLSDVTTAVTAGNFPPNLGQIASGAYAMQAATGSPAISTPNDIDVEASRVPWLTLLDHLITGHPIAQQYWQSANFLRTYALSVPTDTDQTYPDGFSNNLAPKAAYSHRMAAAAVVVSAITQTNTDEAQGLYAQLIEPAWNASANCWTEDPGVNFGPTSYFNSAQLALPLAIMANPPQARILNGAWLTPTLPSAISGLAGQYSPDNANNTFTGGYLNQLTDQTTNGYHYLSTGQPPLVIVPQMNNHKGISLNGQSQYLTMNATGTANIFKNTNGIIVYITLMTTGILGSEGNGTIFAAQFGTPDYDNLVNFYINSQYGSYTLETARLTGGTTASENSQNNVHKHWKPYVFMFSLDFGNGNIRAFRNGHAILELTGNAITGNTANAGLNAIWIGGFNAASLLQGYVFDHGIYTGQGDAAMTQANFGAIEQQQMQKYAIAV